MSENPQKLKDLFNGSEIVLVNVKGKEERLKERGWELVFWWVKLVPMTFSSFFFFFCLVTSQEIVSFFEITCM